MLGDLFSFLELFFYVLMAFGMAFVGLFMTSPRAEELFESDAHFGDGLYSRSLRASAGDTGGGGDDDEEVDRWWSISSPVMTDCTNDHLIALLPPQHTAATPSPIR